MFIFFLNYYKPKKNSVGIWLKRLPLCCKEGTRRVMLSFYRFCVTKSFEKLQEIIAKLLNTFWSVAFVGIRFDCWSGAANWNSQCMWENATRLHSNDPSQFPVGLQISAVPVRRIFGELCKFPSTYSLPSSMFLDVGKSILLHYKRKMIISQKNDRIIVTAWWKNIKFMGRYAIIFASFDYLWNKFSLNIERVERDRTKVGVPIIKQCTNTPECHQCFEYRFATAKAHIDDYVPAVTKIKRVM